MKRRDGFTKIELAVVLVILLILAAILYPAFQKSDPAPPRVRCNINLKQLGSAFMQYSQEYDERFPPVALNNVAQSLPPYEKPFGWADAISIYVPNHEVFQCPRADQTASSEDATQSGFTDFWMNTNLSNLKLEKINAPTQTILGGEGNDGTDNTNARYSLNSLPQKWRDTEKSPSRRHFDMANYLFADSHVQWFRHQEITNLPTAKSRGTFSFR